MALKTRQVIPIPAHEIWTSELDKAIQEAEFSVSLEKKRYSPLSKQEKWAIFDRLNYRPHEGQIPIHETTARFKIVGGGRRGGKTTAAVHEALSIALDRPYSLIYWVGKTKEVVSRGWNSILEILAQRGIKTARINNTTFTIEFENHSIIRGKSAEEPGQLVGEGVDFIVIDEAAQLDRKIWDKYLRPTLADKQGGALFIGTYVGTNWFYELGEDAKVSGYWCDQHNPGREWKAGEWEKSWFVHTFETWKNTVIFEGGFQNPEIQAALAGASDVADFYEEYGAIAKEPRNLVLPEFSRPVHAAQWATFDERYPVYLGIDPGTSVPYAVIALQEIRNCPCLMYQGIPEYPQGTHLWIIDEFYQTNVVSEMVIEDVMKRPWFKNLADSGYGIIDVTDWMGEQRRWMKIAKVKIYRVSKTTKDFVKNSQDILRKMLRDPARYKYIVELKMKDKGIIIEDLTPAQYRMEYVQATYDVTDSELAQCTRIHINPIRCPNTIKEAANWQYSEPSKPSLDPPDKPARANDHAMDALIYLCWQKYGIPPRQAPRSYMNG